MAELPQYLTQPPFGEVDVFKEDGFLRVKATILKVPNVEMAQTGLAIDGSKSMADLFGDPNNVFFPKPNLVQVVARKIAAYLANFDGDGETTVIYYSCGKFGADLQELGDMDEAKAEKAPFNLPKRPGTGTQLVPAMEYFLNKFADAPWLICLFITDGLIDDLEKAKQLSQRICQDMASGRRGYTKFVIIGLGSEFNDEDSKACKALEELDDLDDDPVYGVEGQDLWDHKIAQDLQTLDAIFSEVVTEDTIICNHAEVLDSHGNHVSPEGGLESYRDGLPALIRFTMPADSTSFTLRIPSPNGGHMEIEQDISEVL